MVHNDHAAESVADVARPDYHQIATKLTLHSDRTVTNHHRLAL